MLALLSVASIALLACVGVLLVVFAVVANHYQGKALEARSEKAEDERERDSKIAAKMEKRGHTLTAAVFHALASGSKGKLIDAVKKLRDVFASDKDLDHHMDEVFWADFANRTTDPIERKQIFDRVDELRATEKARRDKEADEVIAERAVKSGTTPATVAGLPAGAVLMTASTK